MYSCINTVRTIWGFRRPMKLRYEFFLPLADQKLSGQHRLDPCLCRRPKQPPINWVRSSLEQTLWRKAEVTSNDICLRFVWRVRSARCKIIVCFCHYFFKYVLLIFSFLCLYFCQNIHFKNWSSFLKITLNILKFFMCVLYYFFFE